VGGAPFAPEGVFLSAVAEVCSSTAPSFFSDAPEKVRIEIERDDAAYWRRSLPATLRSSGEFLLLLPSVLIRGSFGDRVL
jgi:hypothetical protein